MIDLLDTLAIAAAIVGTVWATVRAGWGLGPMAVGVATMLTYATVRYGGDRS